MGLGQRPTLYQTVGLRPLSGTDKIRKKDLTLSCSLDEAWWVPDLSISRAYARKPTLTELHRRLRQVVNYTASSLRVNRMRTKTNGLLKMKIIMLIWSGIHVDVIRLTLELPNRS